jgi:tRNA(Leu) C34 or U34 (ribose-2'-O)-methylase TrmL
MVSIGLINPKSASNVAAILRACSGFGASSVFYSGNRFRYAKPFNADTQNMRYKIPTVGVDNLLSMQPTASKLVVVELVENAIALPEFIHPENAFYVFGPEDGSVPQDIVQQADSVVFIPCQHNLNLGASANIVLYDRLAKQCYDASNTAIRYARDNNNNRRLV